MTGNKFCRRISVAALSAVLVLTGCSSENNFNVDVTGDCAITSMVLGQLRRTMHSINSEGRDTTYVTSVEGSLYPLHIDQLKREIYNTDSLPRGTHTDRIVFSSIQVDGYLRYRITETGQDTLYSAGDSLDFTQPRLFTVTSADGSATRTYTVRIVAHQSNMQEFTWRKLEEGNTAFVVKDSVLYTADGSTIVAYPAAKPQTKFETGAEVTTIASYAFAAATNLTELELTAGVSRIGEGAFSGCTNIASIVSRPTTPPTIADNTFSGVDKSIPVYVPANSLTSYEEAEHWKDFFENFQPIPGTGLAAVEQLEGVYVVNGRVMVYGYTGEISVFDVSGRCVLTTTDSSFALPQGAYLLRAGNAAAKVLVP